MVEFWIYFKHCQVRKKCRSKNFRPRVQMKNFKLNFLNKSVTRYKSKYLNPRLKCDKISRNWNYPKPCYLIGRFQANVFLFVTQFYWVDADKVSDASIMSFSDFLIGVSSMRIWKAIARHRITRSRRITKTFKANRKAV